MRALLFIAVGVPVAVFAFLLAITIAEERPRAKVCAVRESRAWEEQRLRCAMRCLDAHLSVEANDVCLRLCKEACR